jgi:hypothetical protein
MAKIDAMRLISISVGKHTVAGQPQLNDFSALLRSE